MSSTSQYQILIVDDHHDNRRLLRHMMEKLVDAKVWEATNGNEAIHLWRQWRPQLIWMDLQMPEVSGYEATRSIRLEEQQADPAIISPTVIIALTGQAYAEDCDRALDAGCNDFISKPFQIQTVLDAIAKHLGNR
ncbi:MAG: response regulator [Elainellaceae cyanobacterium]